MDIRIGLHLPYNVLIETNLLPYSKQINLDMIYSVTCGGLVHKL